MKAFNIDLENIEGGMYLEGRISLRTAATVTTDSEAGEDSRSRLQMTPAVATAMHARLGEILADLKARGYI